MTTSGGACCAPKQGKSNFYSAAATTGLWRHLQSIHKLEREDAVQKWIVEDAARKKQQLLTALDEAERKKKVNDVVADYIVHCERPLNTVDRPSFKGCCRHSTPAWYGHL